MKIKYIRYQQWIAVLGLMIFASCSYPKNFTRDFYSHNEQKLTGIKDKFRALYDDKPFALVFEDKHFNEMGFEIITDSIKYIYRFKYGEPAFTDTLKKYHFDYNKMLSFIEDLKQIHCTWITNLDYYEENTGKYLVLMAVRNSALNTTFKGESYCLLTFFNSPQPYDKKERILDKSERRFTRRINGSKLYRVNDYVGYSIAKHYR